MAQFVKSRYECQFSLTWLKQKHGFVKTELLVILHVKQFSQPNADFLLIQHFVLYHCNNKALA